MKIIMTAKLTNPLTRATALYLQNLLMSSRGEPMGSREKTAQQQQPGLRPCILNGGSSARPSSGGMDN